MNYANKALQRRFGASRPTKTARHLAATFTQDRAMAIAGRSTRQTVSRAERLDAMWPSRERTDRVIGRRFLGRSRRDDVPNARTDPVSQRARGRTSTLGVVNARQANPGAPTVLRRST